MRGSVVVVEQRCRNSLPPRAAAPHPSRSRHLRGAVVAVLAAVTPVLFTRLARPWRRNSRCVDVLRRAKEREDAMDARGATVLYARTRAKLRRRAAWDGDARSLLNVADAKLLEALIRSDETAGPLAREVLRDGAVARVGRSAELAAVAEARANASAWPLAVAACRARRGCWLARMAAAARHGADARDPFDEGPGASGEGSGGGWALPESLENLCEVDRRRNLTRIEFHERYVDAARPVLLVGGARGDAARWTRAALIARAGDAVVPAARDGHVRRRGGAKDVAPTAPLRDVIAALGAADAPYVLAPDPLEEDLAAAAAPPRGYFDDAARFSRDDERRRRGALLYVGARGSATGFHEHSNAYNALFFGAKLFALLPPFAGHWRRDGARGDTVVEDLGRLRPRAMQRLFPERTIRDGAPALGPLATPRLCVQRAGDLLFVPTGWAHAVVNLAETVDVAVEVGDRPDLASAGGPS